MQAEENSYVLLKSNLFESFGSLNIQLHQRLVCSLLGCSSLSIPRVYLAPLALVCGLCQHKGQPFTRTPALARMPHSSISMASLCLLRKCSQLLSLSFFLFLRSAPAPAQDVPFTSSYQPQSGSLQAKHPLFFPQYICFHYSWNKKSVGVQFAAQTDMFFIAALCICTMHMSRTVAIQQSLPAWAGQALCNGLTQTIKV